MTIVLVIAWRLEVILLFHFSIQIFYFGFDYRKVKGIEYPKEDVVEKE